MEDAPTTAKGDSLPSATGGKSCFVIAEFGRDEATRLASKQTLKHLIRKVLEPMGYRVERADDIDDLGQITHQVIERLLDDDLVVADLSGLNPNVFYELAVRHAARKPVITLMTEGQSIPFDLKDVRTIFYDLHNPDSLEAAQQDLKQKAVAIEANPTEIRNPITVTRNVTLLQQSDDPETQAAGVVLAAITDLRDEVRVLGRRVNDSQTRLSDSQERRAWSVSDLTNIVRRTVTSSAKSLSTEEVASAAGLPIPIAEAVLSDLRSRGDSVFLVDGRWSDIPF